MAGEVSFEGVARGRELVEWLVGDFVSYMRWSICLDGFPYLGWRRQPGLIVQVLQTTFSSVRE